MSSIYYYYYLDLVITWIYEYIRHSDKHILLIILCSGTTILIADDKTEAQKS
jgi:hypothetical protein